MNDKNHRLNEFEADGKEKKIIKKNRFSQENMQNRCLVCGYKIDIRTYIVNEQSANEYFICSMTVGEMRPSSTSTDWISEYTDRGQPNERMEKEICR